MVSGMVSGTAKEATGVWTFYKSECSHCIFYRKRKAEEPAEQLNKFENMKEVAPLR